MPDLLDGQSTEMKGSGAKPYILKNVGGVYSCSCPAWRNQSMPIERRTCKHLRKLRGYEAEDIRTAAGSASAGASASAAKAPKAEPGEPKKAAKDGPPLMLAESWDGVLDPSGWWMSEKLDGVRALWDASQRLFISRQGNVYHAPDWFTEKLPNVNLDGELWIGRKQFQRTVSVVRRQDKNDHWREVRYRVFDAPTTGGEFEERLTVAINSVLKAGPYAEVLTQTVCRDMQHVYIELGHVEAQGGEGLMLRQPRSLYAAGRTATLLKVKSFKDAEGEVIAHQPGKGRHKGRLGALLLRLANGIEVAVGTGLSDAERDAPPPVGSTVKFRYQELTDGGVPRFPSYVGVHEGSTVGV